MANKKELQEYTIPATEVEIEEDNTIIPEMPVELPEKPTTHEES